MISDKRKLFIHIGAKAFKTSNRERLESFVDAFVDGLNEEEKEYAMGLFKGVDTGNERDNRNKIGDIL